MRAGASAGRGRARWRRRTGRCRGCTAAGSALTRSCTFMRPLAGRWHTHQGASSASTGTSSTTDAGRCQADVRAHEQVIHDELGRHFAGDAGAALGHRDHDVVQLDHRRSHSSTQAVTKVGHSIGSTMLQVDAPGRDAVDPRGLPDLRVDAAQARPASAPSPGPRPARRSRSRACRSPCPDRTIQSKREAVQAERAHASSDAELGLSIHCQTRPVATNDIAYGYRNTVRSTPSPRHALVDEHRQQEADRPGRPATNSTPYTRHVVQRQHPALVVEQARVLAPGRRSRATGSVRELLNEIAQRPQHRADVRRPAPSRPSAAAPAYGRSTWRAARRRIVDRGASLNSAAPTRWLFWARRRPTVGVPVVR